LEYPKKAVAENKDLRLWVQSPAAHPSNFSTPDCKKKSAMAPSVRVIVIHSDPIDFDGGTLIKILIVH